jgi:hypothetical protein
MSVLQVGWIDAPMGCLIVEGSHLGTIAWAIVLLYETSTFRMIQYLAALTMKPSNIRSDAAESHQVLSVLTPDHQLPCLI